MLLSLAVALAVGITPSSDSQRLLDSGLKVLGMQRMDCAMPPDMVTADAHRLPFHDSLFTEPFAAFDRAATYAPETWTLEQAAATLRSAVRDLHLGTWRDVSYGLRRTPDELKKAVGVDLTAQSDKVGSILVLRTVEAIVDALEATKDVRKRWFNTAVLREQCDSIWMNAEEDEYSDLFTSVIEGRKARKRIEQFFATADPESVGEVYVQGANLYLHCLQVVNDAVGSRAFLTDTVSTRILQTSIGRIAIGGPGNDTYQGSFVLIIDIGGNDSYLLDNGSKASAIERPFRVILDLDGDDIYRSNGYDVGTGVCGAGIVIDQAGNDVYSTGDFSAGCGLFGVGVLHDRAGNDSYLSGQNVQGAGIFGIGLLIDESGHDTYRSHAQAQGFGGTRGIGLLHDTKGNDQYLAASPYVDVLRYEAHYVTFTQGAALGHRPIASGGIGVLSDLDGNDLYSTDIYGQGTGYWFGLGALIDRNGEDRYQAYQYAQGSGVHFATGLLLDANGDDVYASHGVSQGCGHDVALGALIDERGSDVYTVESLSLGGGNANAVSVFIDRVGDDSYIARNASNTMGYSDFRRWMGNVGIFVDGGGSDLYGSSDRNGAITVKSTYGTFLDAAIIQDSTPSQPKPSYAEIPLSDDVDSLFIQASAAPLKYQNNVEMARTKLAEMGTGILTSLSVYFDTDMPRERLALETILPKMREKDSTRIDSVLIDELRYGNPAERNLAATVAGKVKAKSTVPYLIEMASDTSWKIRRLAALTLGQIGDTIARPTLIQMLNDPHPYVRARAGYAHGLIGDENALDTARTILVDSIALVRYTTAEGFSRGKTRPFEQIARRWNTNSTYDVMMSSAILLRSCDTTDLSKNAFREYYRTASEEQRTAIDRTLPSLPPLWSQAQASSSEPPEATSKKKKRTKK